MTLNKLVPIDEHRIQDNLGKLVRGTVAETLTCYQFPGAHWRRIRTNNTLGPIIREIRRRTRVVGAFPDGKSALMLVAARLRHIAGSEWGSRRCLIRLGGVRVNFPKSSGCFPARWPK